MPMQEGALLKVQQDHERAEALAKGAQEAAESAQQRLEELQEQQRTVEGELQEATASHDRLKLQQAQVHLDPSSAGIHGEKIATHELADGETLEHVTSCLSMSLCLFFRHNPHSMQLPRRQGQYQQKTST